MSDNEVMTKISNLKVWNRAGVRAPHKPLLILVALGRLSREERRLIRFTETRAELTSLLRDFGPPRKSYHPEYPFWHLQSDVPRRPPKSPHVWPPQIPPPWVDLSAV